MNPSSAPIVRIAVVDDDKLLLEVFSSMMKRSNYHVHFFSSPAAALQEITAIPGHYHLVISDIRMPGMNGVEFAKKVRAAEPNIPLILMSGDVSDELKQEAMGLKRAVFLEKPFPLEQTLKEFIPKFLRNEL